ncbi:MAG: Rab family GTPase [Candidatus Hodarchaeota archaeon]
MSKVDTGIFTGVLYSVFDEKMGPIPLIREPGNIPKDIQEHVANETINLTLSESKVVKSLAIIPFPSEIKALTKISRYNDPERRGGACDTTLTLIFNQKDDVIIYKYMHDFEEIFEKYAMKIIELQETKQDLGQIHEVVKEFYESANNLVGTLYKQETGPIDAEAFPEDDYTSIRKRPYKYKVIVCGDPAVGKTSLILKFIDKAFKRTYLPTLGVNISDKIFEFPERQVSLVIWDIAGQAKFNMFRKQFYSGAHGIILVYDITSKNSFTALKAWYNDIRKTVSAKIGFIAGNKCDLEKQRAVSKEEMLNLGEELGFETLETSALTGDNVEKAFGDLARALLDG